MKAVLGMRGSVTRAGRGWSTARGVAATIAGLTVALVTAPMTKAAETVVHQRSGGRTAYVEAASYDGCAYGYIFASPSTFQMVSKAAGGKTTVTDSSVMDAYVYGENYCVGTFFYAEFDAVALTSSQFQLAPSLTQAALHGDINASWGYLYDGGPDYTDLAGVPIAFALQWQGTGTGPTARTPTHSRGSWQTTVNATGTTVGAIASGFVSVGGFTVNVDSLNQYAVMSQNLRVSTAIKRNYPMVIPAGKTVSLTNATLNACDPLTYGYQVNDGALVPVGSKTSFCGTQPVGDVTIGPFAQRSVLRIYVLDKSAISCSDYPSNYTYFSDGLHGLVTGKDPWQVDITDSGIGCSSPADEIRLPDAPGQGNLNVTVVTGP